MDRRRALVALAASLGGAPFRARGAVEASKQVAILTFVNGPVTESDRQWKRALLKSFAANGFRQGDNIEVRWYEVAAQSPWDTTVPNAISRLMATAPDCIVALNEPLVDYVKRMVRSTPVVVDMDDPVRLGIAASLTRPGANFTGLHRGEAEVAAKEVELLKAIVPGLRCVAFIGFRPQLLSFPALEAAARQAGLSARKIVPPLPTDPKFHSYLRAQFAGLRAEGCLAGHFQTSVGPFLDAVFALALEHRIALAYSGGENVDRVGILFNYGIDRLDGLRSAQRIPAIVARILRGERPADIAFEGPTGYRLVLNVKTAERLRLAIPPSVLIMADEVRR